VVRVDLEPGLDLERRARLRALGRRCGITSSNEDSLHPPGRPHGSDSTVDRTEKRNASLVERGVSS
jgi:hypothetical protein